MPFDPFNPAARSFLDQASGPFLHQTGDPVAAQQLALQTLSNLRQQQASAVRRTAGETLRCGERRAHWRRVR
jgi:hypothetical protein